MKAAIRKYVAQKGVAPRSWIDLTTERGYLDQVPKGKDGRRADFDEVIKRMGVAPAQ